MRLPQHQTQVQVVWTEHKIYKVRIREQKDEYPEGDVVHAPLLQRDLFTYRRIHVEKRSEQSDKHENSDTMIPHYFREEE